MLGKVIFFALISCCFTQIHPDLQPFDWLIGTWEGKFHGKVRWPTIPTMTYGETLIIEEAPVPKTTGKRFLNFKAISWSHGTKDHLHDEWGYLGLDRYGQAVLMTTGNNGFNKYEAGPQQYGWMRLDLDDIGRISFSRDLPVTNLRRTFSLVNNDEIRQVLEMRTETHPSFSGMLEHARITYTRVK